MAAVKGGEKTSEPRTPVNPSYAAVLSPIHPPRFYRKVRLVIGHRALHALT